MNPKTPATRSCAEHCCGRIDLAASPRAAWLWSSWLALCAGAILSIDLSFDLPIFCRVLLCIALVASNARPLCSLVLLKGPRAIGWIGWSESGEWRVGSVAPDRVQSATLHPASFRMGSGLLVLWFETSAGRKGVLIDGKRQDPAAFRRLTRRLRQAPETHRGPSARAS